MRCRSAPPGYKEPARTIGVFNEGDSDKAAKPVAYCRHHGAPGAGGLTPLQSAMVMGHAGRGNTRRASVSSGKASESYEERGRRLRKNVSKRPRTSGGIVSS